MQGALLLARPSLQPFVGALETVQSSVSSNKSLETACRRQSQDAAQHRPPGTACAAPLRHDVHALRRRRHSGGKRRPNGQNAQPGRRLGPRRALGRVRRRRAARGRGGGAVPRRGRVLPRRRGAARRARAGRRRAAQGRGRVRDERGARLRQDVQRGRGRRGLLRGHARLLRGPRGRRCHERAARAAAGRVRARRRVHGRDVPGGRRGPRDALELPAAPGGPQGRAGRRRGLPLRAQAEPPRVAHVRRLFANNPGPAHAAGRLQPAHGRPAALGRGPGRRRAAGGPARRRLQLHGVEPRRRGCVARGRALRAAVGARARRQGRARRPRRRRRRGGGGPSAGRDSVLCATASCSLLVSTPSPRHADFPPQAPARSAPRRLGC